MPSPKTPKKSPRSQTRKHVNRQAELHRVAKELGPKHTFVVQPTRKLHFPGQHVRLYGKTLHNNFAGQQLKEANPSEYLRQMKKLGVKEKQNAERAIAAEKARLASLHEEQMRRQAARLAFEKQIEAMRKANEQRRKRKEENEMGEMAKLAALFSGSTFVPSLKSPSRGPGSRGASNSKQAEALRKLWNEW